MRKLVLTTCLDLDFKLIGINASLEAFKLAFLINNNLRMQFKRAKKDVKMYYENSNIYFSLYLFCDSKTTCKLYLIQNKSVYVNQKPKFATSLFENQQEFMGKHLIKSNMQSDYLIKIEDEFDRFKTKKLIHNLNEIPQIISAYKIPNENINSPENLIFE